MGRSMGTGPACILAAYFNPAALVTISAFTSLQGIAENYIGIKFEIKFYRFNFIKISKLEI